MAAPQFTDTKVSLDEKEKSTTTGAEVTITAGDYQEGTSEPTAEDYSTLRRVAAGMPLVAILMCAVEFVERASYYGTQQPFNNFINNPLPAGGNGAGAVAHGAAGTNQSAGALGLGSATTSALTKMFTFLAYVIPIFGGMVADTKWGRFKTIVVGTAVGAIAHVILIIPAIPSIIAKPNASLGTFIISIIILAFAAGFIKPSLGPLLCDQSPVKTAIVKTTKSGERVIVDPQQTVSRYLLFFYLCINMGSLIGQLAAQYSARLVGFWLAFLVPGIMYMLLPPLLWWASPRLVKMAPQGSVVPDAWRVIKICLSNGGWTKLGRGGAKWWDRALPEAVHAQTGQAPAWDATFVEEVRQTFAACGVFLLIPIFVLADGGIGNSLNDQSVAMTLDGMPNDLINNFNPIAIIACGPIVTYILYPFLDRRGWSLSPMWKMFIGYMLGCAGCIFAAVVQARVYATSPCGKYASNCELGVSPVSLWWQLPSIFLPALGEIFVNVTSYEIAYTRSPPRMKGLVYSLALFNSAIGAAISMALAKVITDPNLVIPWIVLAVISFVCAFLFPTYFKHLDQHEFTWSEEEKEARQVEAKKGVEAGDNDKY